MAQTKSGDIIKNAILIVAPILCGLFILFFDLSPGHREVTYTAAIALLMSVWWITEAIPLAATALLPLFLFPAFGIMDGKAVSSEYINNVIFIFIGGFLVALAMERWNLHKRLALRILMFLGVQPRFILLGFMLSTAFISMWVSNTATAMMMVPIGIAVVSNLEEILGIEKVRKFAIAIFLGIAYSASIGGIATLIGTPPNLVFVKIFNTFFPKAPVISFAQWLFFALPVAVVFLFLVWGLLSLMFCPRKGLGLDKQIFSDQYKALGPISYEEKIVLVDFFILVLLWIFRADINIGSFTIPGWSNLFPDAGFIDDGTVAVTMAFILFLIPARNQNGGNGGRRILTWKTATGLPWDIVLLFGGGFALASGFTTSGLSEWLGKQLEGLGSLPPILVVACVCFLLTFLTELTSNTAISQILLPILAALSVSIRVNPLLLMIPGTLSASFAFMLPVGTPPNAIVFGTKRVRIVDMARVGLILNFIGIIIVTLAIFLLGKAVFGIDLSKMPEWMIK